MELSTITEWLHSLVAALFFIGLFLIGILGTLAGVYLVYVTIQAFIIVTGLGG